MTNLGDYIWFLLLDWTFGYGPHTKGESLFDEEGKVKDLPRENPVSFGSFLLACRVIFAYQNDEEGRS